MLSWAGESPPSFNFGLSIIWKGIHFQHTNLFRLFAKLVSFVWWAVLLFANWIYRYLPLQRLKSNQRAKLSLQPWVSQCVRSTLHPTFGRTGVASDQSKGSPPVGWSGPRAHRDTQGWLETDLTRVQDGSQKSKLRHRFCRIQLLLR